MRLSIVAALLVVHLLLPTVPCRAQAAAPPTAQPFSHEQERHKANENLIVVMAGALGSSYLQLADDIAVVVSNRDSLRVVPAIGSGEAASVRDVLLVRGVDLAITSLQVLDMLKASGELGPGLDKQIAYIAPLSVEVFHLLAGAGSDSVQQLKGKKVAFGLKDSGAARFGPGLLKAVGAELAEPGAHSHIVPGDAAHAIRSGNLAAVLYSGPLPIPSVAEVKPGAGFKLLELNYVPALEQNYLPASITSEHYPHLIAKGERVQSVAGSMVLITFNWPPGSERYRRVEKFTTAFFANADKLKLAPRHPAWHGSDDPGLAAVPGCAGVAGPPGGGNCQSRCRRHRSYGGTRPSSPRGAGQCVRAGALSEGVRRVGAPAASPDDHDGRRRRRHRSHGGTRPGPPRSTRQCGRAGAPGEGVCRVGAPAAKPVDDDGPGCCNRRRPHSGTRPKPAARHRAMRPSRSAW